MEEEGDHSMWACGGAPPFPLLMPVCSGSPPSVPLHSYDEDEMEEGEEEDVPLENGQAFPLLELPAEIVLVVLSFLGIADLNVVRAAGSRLLTTLADEPTLWHSIYDRHRMNGQYKSVVMCCSPVRSWRGGTTPDPEEIERFGWRQLAITLMKKNCFQCGAQPSFVVFLDNTRKCQKCISADKLRREVEETKRWEQRMSQAQPLPEEENKDAMNEESRVMGSPRGISEKHRAMTVSRRLTRLGALLGEAGKHAEAETLLQEVLDRDVALYGDNSLVVANHYYHLSHLCKLRSNTFVYVRDEKIKICRRGMEYIAKSMSIYETYLAGIHRMDTLEGSDLMLRVGDCLCMLAGYLCTTSIHLIHAHKLEAEQNALKFLGQATTIYRRFGNEMGLAEAYRILAGIYADTIHQDKAKAIDYLQRSLLLVDKIFGRESVQAADIMQKFGYMYWNWDRETVAGLEKSLDWHQQELNTRIKVMGKLHPITKRAREDVFIILDRLSRNEEAQALYAGLPVDDTEDDADD